MTEGCQKMSQDDLLAELNKDLSQHPLGWEAKFDDARSKIIYGRTGVPDQDWQENHPDPKLETRLSATTVTSKRYFDKTFRVGEYMWYLGKKTYWQLCKVVKIQTKKVTVVLRDPEDPKGFTRKTKYLEHLKHY